MRPHEKSRQAGLKNKLMNKFDNMNFIVTTLAQMVL